MQRSHMCWTLGLYNCVKILVGNTEEKRPFGILVIDWRIILKWI